MSPISSKNNVPPLACSNRPILLSTAPVNEPFSCPNNSDSTNSLGISAIFKAINGISCLGLFLWSDFAINSFPVPDSPCIRTVAIVFESFPIDLNTFCIAFDSPIISNLVSFFKPFVFGFSSSAL